MEKRPYWYKVEMRGIDRIQSATAAGSASMNARRNPQSRSDVYSPGFAVVVQFRERRQEHRAEGDAEQRAWKLHQPVGIRDPRDAAVAERRGELRVDERRDLRRRHADHGRAHRHQHAAHAVVAPVEARPSQHADLHERPDLQRELRGAADEARPTQAP